MLANICDPTEENIRRVESWGHHVFARRSSRHCQINCKLDIFSPVTVTNIHNEIVQEDALSDDRQRGAQVLQRYQVFSVYEDWQSNAAAEETEAEHYRLHKLSSFDMVHHEQLLDRLH